MHRGRGERGEGGFGRQRGEAGFGGERGERGFDGERGFGRSERRGPRRGPGRGRVPRGDVRTAVLQLLGEEPMHGYQLMQAIADRSGGRWTPSPGAIYPTINQLEDEGLVTVTAEAGRKLVTLTDAGREYVEGRRETTTDPFAPFATAEGSGTDLRGLLEEVHVATRQVTRTGSEEQRAAAAKILADARRSLYLLLADGPQTPEQTPES
ncbi:PadR family transcriptional regulator [Kribbella sp. NPDC006257]|uniref:PadR family transcriptional regulator n=1 Tax=Kribbella sp. NPDC006257 TaxID=3156738 RepID=UPI0033B84DED